MNTESRGIVAGLLQDTGRAHHEAFEATDGADRDWPEFHADEIVERFVPA